MNDRILIIEDEERSAARLEKLIAESHPDAQIVGKCESVAESLDWFANHPAPDLIFSDIQLSDGLSFEVFELIRISTPVIFTTAYDQYAIRAFKSNGIDYLLKPIVPEELTAALERFFLKRQTSPESPASDWLAELTKAIQRESISYRTRFLVKMGEKFKSFESADLVCLEGRDKSTWIVSPDGRSYPIDDTLEKLEQTMDPKQFFRISRKYIVNAAFIKVMEAYPNSRIRLTLNGYEADDIIVARERTQAFKLWLGN